MRDFLYCKPVSGAISLFTYTDHIHLPGLGLSLDPPGRAEFAFVSHGHSDHIGRHRRGFATPPTVELVACRLGRTRLEPLEFGETIEREGHRIQLVPAGHVLGAAQLVVDAPAGHRLVYTGDFSPRERLTVPAATPVPADILIMECTFGRPRYAFPKDAELRDRIRAFVERARIDGAAPVVLGYALGKSQEAMAVLHKLGFPVRIHPTVAPLAEVYRRHQVELGPYAIYDGTLRPDEVLVAPPSVLRTGLPRGARTLYLSGWAIDRATKYRLGVDQALPFSDHADFPELVEFVRRVSPRQVFTTHGPSAFADHLCRLGFEAKHLGDHQSALF